MDLSLKHPDLEGLPALDAGGRRAMVRQGGAGSDPCGLEV